MRKEDKIEKVFKEKLQNYEAPYDASAWQSMSAMLDAKAGGAVAKAGASSKLTTWLVAGISLVAVISGVYFFTKDKSSNDLINQATEIVKVDTLDKGEENTVESNNEVDSKLADDSSNAMSNIDEMDESQSNDSELIAESDAGSSLIDNMTVSSNVNDEQDNSSVVDLGDRQVSGGGVVSAPQGYIAGQIAGTTVCENDKVVISNPEVKYGKVKFKIYGRWIELNPTEVYEFVPAESMEIAFVDKNNEVIAKEFIKVNSLPSVNFGYQANIFEKGLPIATFEAYGDYATYTWNFDGEELKGEDKVKYSFFDKGKYNVELSVVDANNCKASITRMVDIHDRYNLMAVNTFKPNDTDTRNSSFMPFSLTERDVRFNLTIVDPNDNGVVFTSDNADNAWDGTDQRNGKMTQAGKVYIWRVQIYNPEKNERPIYTGTIIHN